MTRPKIKSISALQHMESTENKARMSSRERSAQQDNRSRQAYEREGETERHIHLGKTGGYRAEAGGFLLRNSSEA
jgi:hypothetical protein